MAAPAAISICRIIIGVPYTAGMPGTTWPTVISGVTVTFFSAVIPTVTLSSGFMI